MSALCIVKLLYCQESSPRASVQHLRRVVGAFRLVNIHIAFLCNHRHEKLITLVQTCVWELMTFLLWEIHVPCFSSALKLASPHRSLTPIITFFPSPLCWPHNCQWLMFFVLVQCDPHTWLVQASRIGQAGNMNHILCVDLLLPFVSCSSKQLSKILAEICTTCSIHGAWSRIFQISPENLFYCWRRLFHKTWRAFILDYLFGKPWPDCFQVRWCCYCPYLVLPTNYRL